MGSYFTSLLLETSAEHLLYVRTYGRYRPVGNVGAGCATELPLLGNHSFSHRAGNGPGRAPSGILLWLWAESYFSCLGGLLSRTEEHTQIWYAYLKGGVGQRRGRAPASLRQEAPGPRSGASPFSLAVLRLLPFCYLF